MNRINVVVFATLVGLLARADYSRAQVVFSGYPGLVTMTNPAPALGNGFGVSLAILGTDKVIIGASGNSVEPNTYPGAAYLYDLNGTRLTTFTNPNPAHIGDYGDQFGCAVAAVGSDKVLIGAYLDDAGTNDTGTAYLFSTNGTLLTTFTNPTPARYENFGFSVAAVGADRVLIGSPYDSTAGDYAGAAYLFDLDGALLTTFTLPPPVSSAYLGVSLAAVGTDKVIIGAFGVNTGAPYSGAAYLFDLNGSLLTTFTNPTPAFFEQFGDAVAAVGPDRVIIGAPRDNTGADGAGAAYLFSTDGVLLATLTNPAPGSGNEFGWSVAGVGTDKVLIGAERVDTGASRSGGAYLFDLNGRLLNIFASPKPVGYEDFGFSVAAVGIDKVLIGQPANFLAPSPGGGAAYLFCIPKQPSPFPCFVTVTNPSPEILARFGSSVAPVGDNTIIVGAPYGYGNPKPGAAYLIGSDGAPLATFTNPSPVIPDYFGASVAAVGTNKVIIGAYGANVAHLYSTGGILLTTFTNPVAAAFANFGYAVAAAGPDKVVIGANGGAYLLDLDGTLLTTFTNPVPTPYGHFGNAVAGVGTDKILIGSRERVSLFDLNGLLLRTASIPLPQAESLSPSSMAVIGVDKFIVGAPNWGATPDGGRAYLLNFDGQLLTTFTNPTPAFGDNFGMSVTVIDGDKVLIGAPGDNSGASDAGAAYLFDLDGTLLTTIYNPNPAVGDSFGSAVAALGSEKIVIGTPWDSVGATNAGSAYVFCQPRPQLQIAQSSGTITVRWEKTRLFSGYMLDCSANLFGSTDPLWTEVAFPYQTNATHVSVAMPASSGNGFFRLRKL